MRGRRRSLGSAQRQSVSGARFIGDRSMLDARSFMISTLRSQVGFAAAVAHARYIHATCPPPPRASASRVSSSSGALSGRTAGRYACHLPRAPSFRRPPSSRRGRGALGAGLDGRVAGLLGAASSESILSRPRGAVPRAGRWQVWIVGSSSVLRRAWSRPQRGGGAVARGARRGLEKRYCRRSTN